MGQGILRPTGQGAGQDLAVNGVGDHQATGAIAAQQPQVHQIIPVIVRDPLGQGARQHGLDDAPHPLFTQLVGQLVEMGDAVGDQVFLGLVDQFDGNRVGRVQARRKLETGPVGQGIDQPGLALGQLPDPLQGRRGEDLPGRGGMFSLDNGREKRFLTRSRLFTDAEADALASVTE